MGVTHSQHGYTCILYCKYRSYLPVVKCFSYNYHQSNQNAFTLIRVVIKIRHIVNNITVVIYLTCQMANCRSTLLWWMKKKGS